MADSLYPKYTLMHKIVPVAEIALDNASCSVSAIDELSLERQAPTTTFVRIWKTLIKPAHTRKVCRPVIH